MGSGSVWSGVRGTVKAMTAGPVLIGVVERTYAEVVSGSGLE